jgi:hypothetical protein
MSLNYGSLEEVHGAPFGNRVPITQQTRPSNEPLAKAEFTSLAQKSRESIAKNRGVVDSLLSSLPLDQEAVTENFTPVQAQSPEAMAAIAAQKAAEEAKKAASTTSSSGGGSSGANAVASAVPSETIPSLSRAEKFTTMARAQSFADANADDKLARILRLIEQNKTGYERPAVQDMVLYIFTGVFFLFTFDTFVQLGKSMRPPRVGRKGSQRT